MTRSHIHIYILFLTLSSVMLHPKWLDIVPWHLQNLNLQGRGPWPDSSLGDRLGGTFKLVKHPPTWWTQESDAIIGLSGHFPAIGRTVSYRLATKSHSVHTRSLGAAEMDPPLSHLMVTGHRFLVLTDAPLWKTRLSCLYCSLIYNLRPGHIEPVARHFWTTWTPTPSATPLCKIISH